MMFSAKTKRNLLVEYPIDDVYDTLVNIFPVRVFRLSETYDSGYAVAVEDKTNYTFIMHIFLEKNTTNTTMVSFIADYPHAIMDLTNGGSKAINIILEKLLIELDKKPKAKLSENDETALKNSNIELLNSKNFVNPYHDETNTKAIAAGYILFFLSLILPIISLSLNNARSSISAFLFIGSVLCLTFLICLDAILIYSHSKKSVMHARIQIALCGVLLIIAGILIFYVLAIIGIVIPAIVIGYSIKNEKEDIIN